MKIPTPRATADKHPKLTDSDGHRPTRPSPARTPEGSGSHGGKHERHDKQ
ncbi:hypothetical protein [Nocardiopsis ganjiahuensis]|nr:hypothetical protein [Nocardiopsis ganjiahuensis]